jgi:hypothetical protein
MTTTIMTTVVIEATHCGSCGVHFGMDASQLKARREDGGSFFCPNGDKISFHETEADKQRKRAERLERQVANREEDLRVERASHTATKGHLTRAKKRADRGVCQHCHRHFANVERHVASQHPEAVAASA